MKKLSFGKKIAHIIRILAVPPVMAALLLLLLWFNGQAITSGHELFASFLFLTAVPATAYPVSFAVPGLRSGGRRTQRKLAFCFSGLGYTAALIYGIVSRSSPELNFIYLTYWLSALLLVLFNRFSKIRASGHACSVIWPAIVSCYYYRLIGAIMGIALYAAVFWCSLKAGRHTISELLLGTFVCLAAVGLSAFSIFVLKLPL